MRKATSLTVPWSLQQAGVGAEESIQAPKWTRVILLSLDRGPNSTMSTVAYSNLELIAVRLAESYSPYIWWPT
jgi:hypothetical protein